MFSKHIKMKSCHPDKLYELLLDRHLKVLYNTLEKSIVHHTMTYRDGKIVSALELIFPDKIIFLNAHIFVNLEQNTINMFNIDKLLEYWNESR